MAALIVEVVLGARHETQYHRVTTLPFSIGRAYDNDLILADDTVSPHHLQINEGEDGLWLQNLSTENGTWAGSLALGSEPQSLNTPLSLALGRTHLKILSADAAVAPTRNFPHASWLTRWGSDLRVALALLSAYLLFSIYFAFERQSMWFKWEEVLVNQLLEIALPLIAATVIGFISRLLVHRWRFPLQLSIACIALGILTFSGEVTSVVSYWLTNYQIASRLSSIVITVCFVGLLAWQLRAVSTLSRKRAGWTSVAIVVPLFLVWELQALINQPAFQSNPPMHTSLKAGDRRVAANVQSIDEFRAQIEAELMSGVAKELDESEGLNADPS